VDGESDMSIENDGLALCCGHNIWPVEVMCEIKARWTARIR